MRPRTLLVLAAAASIACGDDGIDPPPSAQEPAVSSTQETASTPDAPELLGAWTLEYVEDRPVIDRSPAYLQFDADGTASGQASCNRMTGRYTLDGPDLSLGPMAVTRRMCPEALMEQERRVLAALERVASWRIEQGMLVLDDSEGARVFRASPRREAEGA